MRLASDIELKPYTGKAPSLLKGETALDAAERLRGVIAQLRADLHSIRSAPIHSSVAKQNARKAIDVYAERGRIA